MGRAGVADTVAGAALVAGVGSLVKLCCLSLRRKSGRGALRTMRKIFDRGTRGSEDRVRAKGFTRATGELSPW